MKYAYYKEQIEKARSRLRLKKILRQISDDFEGIDGRQYESLRFLIISKMYA